MPLVDRIIAITFLAILTGVLVVRAIRVWADYRRQQHAVELLVRSMTEIERAPKERRP